MSIPQHIEQRIREAAGRMAAAVRREVFRMLRGGMNMQEILNALAAFSVPPAHRKAFEAAITQSMKEIANGSKQIEESSGPSTLSAADVDVLISASDITLPEMNAGMRRNLQQEVRRAIAAGYGPEALRRRLEKTNTGDMSALAVTSIAQFNNNLVFRRSEMSGTTRFLYSGPVAPSTRPFCRAHAGKIFALDQINAMNNGQGLPVRSSCGGYNCRHEWVAVPDRLSDRLAGGTSAVNAEPVKIGKASYMMDAEQRMRLFEHDRMLWVEYQKGVRQGADTGDWLYTAAPLAKAHDSLNPVITNTPAEGSWANIYRPHGLSNFEHHIEERKADGHITDASELLAVMPKIMSDGNATVHSFTTHDNTRRTIVHSPANGWDVMLDQDGKIHTCYPFDPTMRGWLRSKKIGTLESFIGRFK